MEDYLGSTKYDAKIRRITLKKVIADYMDMEDGDYIDYFKIGNDIVIRKQPKKPQKATNMNSIIPIGTSSRDVNLMLDASKNISKYFEMGKRPDNYEMMEIITKVLNTFPDDYSNERKMEMLEMSIRLSKEITSKIRVTYIGRTEEDTDEHLRDHVLKK